MNQLTFSEAEYSNKKRKTHCEMFLDQMGQIIPWKRLENKVKPYYPKKGQGRKPYQMSTMLRIHCMHLSYNPSDLAREDALYKIESMRVDRWIAIYTRSPWRKLTPKILTIGISRS